MRREIYVRILKCITMEHYKKLKNKITKRNELIFYSILIIQIIFT